MKAVNVNCLITPEIKITDISWERILLNVTIESDLREDLSFSLAKIGFPEDKKPDEDEGLEIVSMLKGSLMQDIPLIPLSAKDGIYKFQLNLAAIDGDSFLENGRWRFVAHKIGSSDLLLCTISYDASWTLCEKDKIFPYSKSKYSYNVWFSTYCGDSVNMIPILNSRFMITNPNWRDNLVISERVSFKSKVRCALKKLKLRIIQKTYDIIERRQKKSGRNILFMSETKSAISGNLKYIDARIKVRGLNSEFKLSYDFRKTAGKNMSLGEWYRRIKQLAQQDIIFIDDVAPLFGFLELSDRTKLVQVWHAGEGFKAVGYSRFGKKSAPDPVHSCHKKYDYVVTGSERLVDVYSEVFGLQKDHFLPYGMARLDDFLNEETIKQKKDAFYKAYPECLGKKLILFSPTFRGTGQSSAFYDYTKLNLDEIYDFCGNEYIWAFKMHPFTHGKPKIPDAYSDRIIDISDSGDINDLYYVTDIMITDYSSTYYEFALLGRPILFYTYDRTVYEVHRGVQKTILETAPGKVCDTFDKLMSALKNKDYGIEKTVKFREENFGEYDGKSADRIIDKLLLNDQA